MKLETEGRGTTVDPDSSQLTEALRSLDTEGNSYAILSKSPTDYVQVIRKSANEYQLEYHDPLSDDHFAAAGPVSLDQAEKVFADFHRGGAQWKTMVGFAPMDLQGSKRGCAGGAAATILLVATASLVLIL